MHARKSQRGFALLMVVFAVTLMVIVAMTAAPGILTDGKREREKEMIWRGNQYVRGIKMYYRKNGKFPASLEDLTKPQVGNLHFMRQAYKDPMNKEDGSWRLIYVGPNGQLIGSLKPQPALTMPSAIPGAVQIGTPAANMNGPSVNGQMGAAPGVGTAGGVASTDTDASGNTGQLSASEGVTIMGGNIIGVGSKAKGRSVIVYEKATDYHLFEFYWDPSKDSIGPAPQPNIPGTSTPGIPQGGPGPVGTPGSAPTGVTNPSGPPTQSNPPQN